jgi:uncharacterized protein (TIRG00374 family)
VIFVCLNVLINQEVDLVRKICFRCLKILISGFLVGFLLYRIGLQEVINHLSNVHGGWLLAAILLFTSSHFLGAFQWWLLLKSERIKISWGQSLAFYFVGLFFNNFFISALGGDFLRMYDIRRYTRDGPAAVSTVFLDRALGLFVLSGLGILLMPFILLRSDHRIEILLLCCFLAAGWIVFIFIFFNKPFARPFAWVMEKLIPAGIVVKFREVYRKIHDFGRKRRLVIALVLVSFIIQSGRIVTHFLLAISLGISISPIYFFVIVPVIAIMASLPISIGGIGLREQTGVVLFGIVGMTSLQAFSVEFLAYLVAIVTSIPGGLIFIIRRRIEPQPSHISTNINRKQGVLS